MKEINKMTKEELIELVQKQEKTLEKAKKEQSKNTFQKLNELDVSEHKEKKGKYNYLSWTWAWSYIMERFPKSYYTVYEAPNGMNYFTDGKTAWVKVGFTLVDGEDVKENIEYYPVYDNKHKSLPIGKVTSNDVNTAIKRGMTKAIAYQGLGLYLYAGEDLPQNDEEPKEKSVEVKETIVNEEVADADAISKFQTTLMDAEAIGFDRTDEDQLKWLYKNANIDTIDIGYLATNPNGLSRAISALEQLIQIKKNESEVSLNDNTETF